MKTLTFQYDTVLSFREPVWDHSFLLRCIPLSLPEQTVTELTHSVLPNVTGGAYSTDGFGNVVYTGCIPQKHDRFEYSVVGRVLRNDAAAAHGDPMPCFLYPSELTRMSVPMQGFLDGMQLRGSSLAQAEKIAATIRERLTYESGVSDVSTTAADAFQHGGGVCQDFAHIMLAMCRAADIPARYVSGLVLGEGESHAWVEIWQDGVWYGMDPTAGRAADEGYLKLCTGRDYDDCPLSRGIFSGFGEQTQTVSVKVSEV